MHPALFFVPGDRLSQSELSAARLDGDVVELGDGYLLTDAETGPAARASSIAAIMHANVAASGPTAAWIHGAGDAVPTPHHVQRAVPQRMRPLAIARVVFHDTELTADAVVTIGGIRVATPLRTMIDLVSGIHREPSYAMWAERLANEHPGIVMPAQEEVTARRRMPGRADALRLLERLSQT